MPACVLCETHPHFTPWTSRTVWPRQQLLLLHLLFKLVIRVKTEAWREKQASIWAFGINKWAFIWLATTSESSLTTTVGIRRCQYGAACCFWFTMFGLFEPIVLLLCTEEYFHNWIAVPSSSILKLMGWQLGENLSLIHWWNTIKANSWNGDHRLQKCCLQQSVALSAIHTLVNICNQVLSIWFVSLQYVESRILESTNSSQLWTFSHLRKRVLRNWCRICEKWWWRWNTPPFADFCRMFGIIQTSKIPLRQCGKLTKHLYYEQ